MDTDRTPEDADRDPAADAKTVLRHGEETDHSPATIRGRLELYERLRERAVSELEHSRREEREHRNEVRPREREEDDRETPDDPHDDRRPHRGATQPARPLQEEACGDRPDRGRGQKHRVADLALRAGDVG